MFDKDTSRLSRLTAIVTLLKSKQIITARMIADRFDISTRTAYRDIKTLEEAGIPIFTEEGKGYSLMEGYTLPPVTFTEEEVNALITAEQIIANNKDLSLTKYYSEAITKIKATLKDGLQNKGELLTQRIQIRNNSGKETTSDNLTTLQLAITNRKVVYIDYKAESDDITKRQIEPLGLYHTNDNWILIAYCRLRQDERAFRLDRIRGLQVLEENFEANNFTFEGYIERCLQKRNNP